MKVLLVGNYAPDEQYSMQGFARAVAGGLSQRGIAVQVIAPVPKWANRTTKASAKKWLAYMDKYLLFPPVLRQATKTADVVHILDQGNAMYVPTIRHLPHLVTCHDLLALRGALGELPGVQISRTGKVYQKCIKQGLSQAGRIVCVSDTTRRDVLRLLPQKAEQVDVVLNGLLFPFTASAAKPVSVPQGPPFLLHVGGNQFYKNRPGVLQIYHALRKLRPDAPRLVLAGKPITPAMRQFITDHHLSAFVDERVAVTDSELNTLYCSASALLFPSLYEGFGLPILEAQACGCPVITSDRAPMTEIAGEGALFIPPDRPEEAAARIALLLHNSKRATALREAGYTNLSRFSSEKMIDGYLLAYQKVIDNAKIRVPLPPDGIIARTDSPLSADGRQLQ